MSKKTIILVYHNAQKTKPISSQSDYTILKYAYLDVLAWRENDKSDEKKCINKKQWSKLEDKLSIQQKPICYPTTLKPLIRRGFIKEQRYTYQCTVSSYTLKIFEKTFSIFY